MRYTRRDRWVNWANIDPAWSAGLVVHPKSAGFSYCNSAFWTPAAAVTIRSLRPLMGWPCDSAPRRELGQARPATPSGPSGYLVTALALLRLARRRFSVEWPAPG
jgi:hypothetical protein